MARRRRAEARADEVALLAASAQRWRMTPAAWGGAPTDGFAGVSFEALGLNTLPRRADRRRTPNGTYQMVHVPACATLDRAAQGTGQETGRDGLLVIGWDSVSGADTAVIVLSALVQVPLASVPWAWVAELTRTLESVVERVPTRRALAPDRTAAPTLRLVSWPTSPSDAPGQAPPDARPRSGWGRAPRAARRIS